MNSPVLRWSYVVAALAGAGAMWMWRHAGTESERHPESSRPADVTLSSVYGMDEAGVPSVSAEPARTQPVTETRAAIHAPGVTSAETPYERAMRALEDQGGTDGAAETAEFIRQKHQDIVTSIDDPTWTRTTEQQLLSFFYSQPEIGGADGLEIASVSCRSVGCEIQALAISAEAQTAAGAKESSGFQAAVTRLRDSSQLSVPFQVDLFYTMKVGDRLAYIATLKRQTTKIEH